MIRFESIHFAYIDSPPIFANFNLVLESHKVTAVLGPSGCGKSTLVKLTCGLLKLEAGQIVVQSDPGDGGHRIKGVLFQDDTLLPWLRCVENVVFPKSLWADSILKEHALALLDGVGLKEAAEKRPHELSSGMKKRVEFLRALSADNCFLIADEPFTGLDFHQRRQLWDQWNSIRDREPRTGLLVTHDIDEAISLSDRIIVLSSESPTRIVLDINLVQHAENDVFGAVRTALRTTEGLCS